jgi:hypothetical protein
MLSKPVLSIWAIFGTLLLLTPPSGAQPPQSESHEKSQLEPSKFRTWTDITGKFKTEAALVGLENGKVLLKKKDGRSVALDIQRLSQADQDFVHSQVAAAGKTKASAPARAEEPPAVSSQKAGADAGGALEARQAGPKEIQISPPAGGWPAQGTIKVSLLREEYVGKIDHEVPKFWRDEGGRRLLEDQVALARTVTFDRVAFSATNFDVVNFERKGKIACSAALEMKAPNEENKRIGACMEFIRISEWFVEGGDAVISYDDKYFEAPGEAKIWLFVGEKIVGSCRVKITRPPLDEK